VNVIVKYDSQLFVPILFKREV